MIDPLILLAFVPAALLLNLTPGPDMMFCLGQGLRSGPGAAVAASAGVSMGGLVHVLLAGLGLSTAIAALPHTLDIIRWIGVAYLLWLAWNSWGARTSLKGAAKAKPLSAPRAFWQGFIVNLTNPKFIFFVLAFLPQFVDADRGAVLGQFLTLGLVIGVGGFFINGAIGVMSGTAMQKFGQGGRAALLLSRLSALIFIGLALRLVWFEKGSLQ